MTRRAQRRVDELLERAAQCHTLSRADPVRGARLRALQGWQAERLARTYEDLHRQPQFAAAIEFFLRDLYGPGEFEQRDREFERAWRYLRNALPESLLEVLADALELQVLTAELDWQMAGVLTEERVSASTYIEAYRRVDRRELRERQIDLVVDIGLRLEPATRRPWVALALRTARPAAQAGGFGTLQDFLERGFRACTRLADVEWLFDRIRYRETRLMQALLSPDTASALALLDGEHASRAGAGA